MSISRYVTALAASLTIGLLAMGAARAESPVFVSSAYANIANPSVNGWCSDCGASQHMIDQFSLAAAATLSSTDFAIGSNFGANWNIEVTLFDSNMNLLYSHINTAGSYGVTNVGNGVNLIHAAISGVSLGAGNYFIGWYDPAGMAVPGYPGGTSLVTTTGGYSGTVAAFQINAVPEPETYAMLLAGLAIMGAVRRRAARQA